MATLIFTKEKQAAILLALCLATASCGVKKETLDDDSGFARGELNTRLQEKPLFSQSLTLQDSHQRWLDRCRIRPDKRFLIALKRLGTIFSKEEKSVDCRWHDGKWSVLIGEDEIAELREFADFREQMQFLTKFAKAQLKEKPALFPEKLNPPTKTRFEGAECISPECLFQRLAQTQSKWQSGGRADALVQAEDALIWLMIQDLDLMGTADEISGMSLATAALNDALGIGSGTENRCLLASALGYYADAASIASSLPEQSPARSFVVGDIEKLKSMSSGNQQSVRTQYLLLRLSAKTRDITLWESTGIALAAKADSIALPLIRSADDFSMTDMKMAVALNALSALKIEMDAGGEHKYKFESKNFIWSDAYHRFDAAQEWMARDSAESFEDSMQALKARENGESVSWLPFDAARAKEVFYRSYFNSAIRLLSECFLNLPSAQAWSERLEDALRLKNSRKAPSSSVLQQWYACRKMRTVGHGRVESLDKQIDALKEFSTIAVLDVIGDFDQIAGNRIFDCADSRPSTRSLLADIAQSSLLNISLAQRLRLAQKANGQSLMLGNAVEMAISLRDPKLLLEVLSSSEADVNERLVAIDTLSALKIPTAVTKSQYESVCSRYPKSRVAIEKYARFLLDLKDYKSAETILRTWINQQKTFRFADELLAKVLLAKCLSAQGRQAEALKILNEKPELTQMDRLCERARVFELLGEREEAEQWAREALRQYPNRIEVLATNLDILWRNGRYEDAARLLSQRRDSLPQATWLQMIGPIFASNFAGKKAALMTALGSLTDAGIFDIDNLGQMAHAAYNMQKPEAAFNMLSKVNSGKEHGAELLTTAYRYLKEYESQDKAMKWLSDQLESGNHEVVAGPAFISGQYELLWKFIAANPKVDAQKVWLFRAAALCLDAEERDKRKKMIYSFVKSNSSFESDLAAYLIGKKEESEVLSKNLTEDQCSRAAFFVGWKKLACTPDFIDATEWLDISIAGTTSIEEANWSKSWLQDIVRTLNNYPADFQVSGIKSLKIVPPAKAGDFNARRRFGIAIVR